MIITVIVTVIIIIVIIIIQGTIGNDKSDKPYIISIIIGNNSRGHHRAQDTCQAYTLTPSKSRAPGRLLAD